MKQILFCESKKGFSYYINSEKPVISLCNPSLKAVALNKDKDSMSNEEWEFYREKYDFLLSMGLAEQPEIMKEKIQMHTSEMVKDNIVNTRQIVFEVTDACNLQCEYCGYGKLYGNYDKRRNKKLRIETAYAFLENIREIWQSTPSKSVNKNVYISFYGGEPLLNMPFIKRIVQYIHTWEQTNRNFLFSMTTNAVLLDKYMDFLVSHQFNLLISLDGDEYSHSYRIDIKGDNSFGKIIRNIDLLKETHPEYFREHVNFNSVLHNRNSVNSIYQFIKVRYEKEPRISPLNNSGIVPEKVNEFLAMYRNVSESLHQAENYEQIEKDMFLKLPEYHGVSIFLIRYSGYIFDNYYGLLNRQGIRRSIPTGTCSPFSKKIYITVNGKILPCERIGHQFALGQIESDNSVNWDFNSINDMYNEYFSKLNKYCSTCYLYDSCIQCIFNIRDINKLEHPVCHGYTNREKFISYIENNLSFLETHADDYFKIIDEVTLN